MPDIVRIEDGRVKYVREEIVREVSVESFVANIENRIPVYTGILPRGCLYMMKNMGKCVYLVEVPSSLVPVSFKQERNVSNYVISIPFTQFYVHCNPSAGTIISIMMSVTKTPLVSVTQKVSVPPYLNIFSNGEGNVCTGSMQIPQDAPIKMKVDSVVSAFFEADFNSDLTPCIPAVFGRVRDFREYMEKWADFTKKDRFFACSREIEYKVHRHTPYEIIKEMME